MKILRLSTLTLAMAIAVFSLGFTNASFAGPKNCVENDPRPSCPDSEDPTPAGTFTVSVFFGGSTVASGTQTNVVGTVNGNRRGLGETTMSLTLDILDTHLDRECAPFGFGMLMDKPFAVSTYKDPGSGEFTYVEASFWDFTVAGKNYWLSFLPGTDGGIEGDFLPGTGITASITGKQLTLKVQKGRDKKGPCNVTLVQDWEITVKGE